jgi:putative membrane protein
MDIILESLFGLGEFALYFAISIALLFAFKVLYAFVTPHDEWKLVKEQHNLAAAIGYAGAIVGFCIALAGAATHSTQMLDFLVWAVAALLAQMLAFALLRFTFLPQLAERINNNEVSAGVMLAGMSVGVGLLNAACMSY